MRLTPERSLAIQIIDVFNDVLMENNIMIPSDDREGNGDETPIYGSLHYQLEDDITAMIEKFNNSKRKEDDK